MQSASFASLLSHGSRLPVATLPANPARGSPEAHAKDASQDFESVVLQTMLGEMMTDTGSDGPLGQGAAGGAWRGLLTQDYAKTMAAQGGIGIAAEVYPDILALQQRSAGGGAGAADALRAQGALSQAAALKAALTASH